MFGPGESVLVSDIHCNGTENSLHQCRVTENYSCDRHHSAGVICSKNFSKTSHITHVNIGFLAKIILIHTNTGSRYCVDESGTPPQDQKKIGNIERYRVTVKTW